MSNIDVYTDGSCKKNPGPGCYAYIIRIFNENQIIQEISYAQNIEYTTNNRMEVLAVIKALQKLIQLNLKDNITIYTDSTYTTFGIKKWMYTWHQNNWHRNEKLIPNYDLWIELYKLQKVIQFKINWVKGHSTNQYNNTVDKLARAHTFLDKHVNYE